MTLTPPDVLVRSLSEAFVQIDGLRGMLAERDRIIAELRAQIEPLSATERPAETEVDQ